MSDQPWAKATVGIIAFLVLGITTIWGLIEVSPLSCTLFDLTGKQTTYLLVGAASLGWLVAYAIFLLPGLPVLWRHRLQKRLLTEDAVLREAVAAKRLRIFASGSQTLQRALHPYVGAVSHQLSIELLVRTDGSLARDAVISAEVSRWRRDIEKSNIKVAIRSYRFDTTMIRGIIVDDGVALTGWYYRENGITQGQSDPVFRVTDRPYVLSMCAIFDKMFVAGVTL